MRAGVTASALRRDIHRAATGPVVPTRAARTSPSGSHSAEIFTTVPPAVPPLAVLRPSTTTSGTYSAVAVSSAGDSSVATTTAPAACGGSSHSISADDTNSLAQLDSPTKHRDAPGAKFFPSIATLRGDPKRGHASGQYAKHLASRHGVRLALNGKLRVFEGGRVIAQLNAGGAIHSHLCDACCMERCKTLHGQVICQPSSNIDGAKAARHLPKHREASIDHDAAALGRHRRRRDASNLGSVESRLLDIRSECEVDDHAFVDLGDVIQIKTEIVLGGLEVRQRRAKCAVDRDVHGSGSVEGGEAFHRFAVQQSPKHRPDGANSARHLLDLAEGPGVIVITPPSVVVTFAGSTPRRLVASNTGSYTSSTGAESSKTTSSTYAGATYCSATPIAPLTEISTTPET